MRYSCFYCGSVYTERVDFCTVCFQDKSIIHLPESNQKVYLDRSRQGIKRVEELRRVQEGRIIEGFEILGRFPRVWKMLVYGLPGSGKSTLALKFASAFQDTVLFIALEEGFSESMSRKVLTWEITGNILVSDAQNEREIKMDLEETKPSLLIIDSISAGAGEMVNSNLDIAQIWVCHSTKDNAYKGNSFLGHIVDIILRVEKGFATVEKNRFAKSGETLEIF